MTKEHLKAQNAYHQYHKKAVYHGFQLFFLLSQPARVAHTLYSALCCNPITVIPEFNLSCKVYSMLRTGKGL